MKWCVERRQRHTPALTHTHTAGCDQSQSNSEEREGGEGVGQSVSRVNDCRRMKIMEGLVHWFLLCCVCVAMQQHVHWRPRTQQRAKVANVNSTFFCHTSPRALCSSQRDKNEPKFLSHFTIFSHCDTLPLA